MTAPVPVHVTNRMIALLHGISGGASASAVPKSIVYGTTEFTTGSEFIAQLSLLGKKTGH
jgi:hypothetical protein